MKLEWEEISTEHIVCDEIIDFRRSVYRLPDGQLRDSIYSYSRRDYVVIVAVDNDGKYLCVRQYRQGVKKVTIEFPAGGIERADETEYGHKEQAESSLESAKRELAEETGYQSNNWIHLLTVPSNATIADNYAYLYLAKDCFKAAEQSLDDTEFLEVEKYSEDEINQLIKNDEFPQAMHILALKLAKDY